MADLYRTIKDLMAKQARGGGKNAADALYQRGTVLLVNKDGTYVIDVQGRRLTANPETDIPFTVGARVYVSEVRNGKPVVHGPR